MAQPLPWHKMKKDRLQKNPLLILQWVSIWGNKPANAGLMPLSWGVSLWKAIVLCSKRHICKSSQFQLTYPSQDIYVGKNSCEWRPNSDQRGTSTWDHVQNIWEQDLENSLQQQIWVSGKELWDAESRGWNSTSKLSCLSLLFNTEQVEAGHTAEIQYLHSRTMQDSLPPSLDLWILQGHAKTSLRLFCCLD